MYEKPFDPDLHRLRKHALSCSYRLGRTGIQLALGFRRYRTPFFIRRSILQKMRERMTIMVFVHNGPLKGRSMQINKDSASIGRGPDNDLRIDEPSVSKRHAMIFKTPNGYSIEDLKSQNGTWIDGNLIASGKKMEVESGIPISLGNVLVSAGKPLPLILPHLEPALILANSAQTGTKSPSLPIHS